MTHELSLLLPAVGAIPLAAAWIGRKLRGEGTGLRLGDKVPDFRSVPASDGRTYSRADLREDRALAFIFTANRCPGAKAYDERIAAIQRDFEGRGVRVIGVNSISADLYPSESLSEMRRSQVERELRYPILKDETQHLAHAFGALCTPHVFVFDADHRLRYEGRIDNAFIAERAKQHYLRDALEAVLGQRAPPVARTAPLGCSIDWVRPEGTRARPWLRTRAVRP